MGTITVNVADAIEQEFRETVEHTLGKGKGMLGKSFAEAMQTWVEEKRQKKIAEEALRILGKGYPLGKILYKKRSELYDR